MTENAQGKASLYAKIAAVTGDMKRIPKNGQHAKQGWKYPTWDDITEALNEALGQHNLAIIPEMVEPPAFQILGKNDNQTPSVRCLVVVDFTIADGESGEVVVRRWYGHADDTSGGEKAIDKALTYCEKSFFKKLFVISAGRDDDPEGATSYGDQQNFRHEPPPPRVVSKNGQPPPGQTSGSEPQPRTPEHQTETKATDSTKTAETLFAEAEALGYAKDAVGATLTHFDFPKQANGKIYSPERHTAMFGALLTWKDLHDAIHADTPLQHGLNDGAILKELDYLGVLKPYTASILRDAITLYRGHHAFNAAAKAITPEAAQVLTDHKLLPWRPEKEDLMLATLRNHVGQAQLAQEVAKEAEVEAAQGSADPVGDELDALLMGASATL